MELSLLLQDSEVSSVSSIDPDILVRFAAVAVERSHTESSETPAQGYSRGVVLQLRGARIIGEQEPQVGKVSGGRLQLGGQVPKKLRLPSEFTGPVHLELAFANRAFLVAAGTGLSIGFEDKPNFSESFAC